MDPEGGSIDKGAPRRPGFSREVLLQGGPRSKLPWVGGRTLFVHCPGTVGGKHRQVAKLGHHLLAWGSCAPDARAFASNLPASWLRSTSLSGGLRRAAAACSQECSVGDATAGDRPRRASPPGRSSFAHSPLGGSSVRTAPGTAVAPLACTSVQAALSVAEPSVQAVILVGCQPGGKEAASRHPSGERASDLDDGCAWRQRRYTPQSADRAHTGPFEVITSGT